MVSSAPWRGWLRVHVPPGRLRHGAAAGGGARRAGKLRREDGHVGAAPSVTSHMHSTCARAPFSVSSGRIGASRTPSETSRGAARAHVKEAGRLDLNTILHARLRKMSVASVASLARPMRSPLMLGVPSIGLDHACVSRSSAAASCAPSSTSCASSSTPAAAHHGPQKR